MESTIVSETRPQVEIDADLVILRRKLRGKAEQLVMQDDIDKSNEWFKDTNANPFMSSGPARLTEWDFVNPWPELRKEIDDKVELLLKPFLITLKTVSLSKIK